MKIEKMTLNKVANKVAKVIEGVTGLKSEIRKPEFFYAKDALDVYVLSPHKQRIGKMSVIKEGDCILLAYGSRKGALESSDVDKELAPLLENLEIRLNKVIIP